MAAASPPSARRRPPASRCEGSAAAAATPPLALGLVRPPTLSPPHAPDPAPRRAHPQPEGHRPRPLPGRALRRDGRLRSRQILPGPRHPLLRGPAPLRRELQPLRPPVPGAAGAPADRLPRSRNGGRRGRWTATRPSRTCRLDRRHHGRHRALRFCALFAREAVPVCPEHGVSAVRTDPLAAAERATKAHEGANAVVTYRVPVAGPEAYLTVRESLLAAGYRRLLVKGEARDLDEIKPSEVVSSGPREGVDVVVDRVKVGQRDRRRLGAAIEEAWRRAGGAASIRSRGQKAGGERLRVAQGLTCPTCARAFDPPRVGLFSYQSPTGACPECRGFGRTIGVDWSKVVPDEVAVHRGRCRCALGPARPPSGRRGLLSEVLHERKKIPLDRPWRDLTEEQREAVLSGEGSWRGGKYPGRPRLVQVAGGGAVQDARPRPAGPLPRLRSLPRVRRPAARPGVPPLSHRRPRPRRLARPRAGGRARPARVARHHDRPGRLPGRSCSSAWATWRRWGSGTSRSTVRRAPSREGRPSATSRSRRRSGRIAHGRALRARRAYGRAPSERRTAARLCHAGAGCRGERGDGDRARGARAGGVRSHRRARAWGWAGGGADCLRWAASASDLPTARSSPRLRARALPLPGSGSGAGWVRASGKSSPSTARAPTTSRTSASISPSAPWWPSRGPSGSGKSTLVEEVLYRGLARARGMRDVGGAGSTYGAIRGATQIFAPVLVEPGPRSAAPRGGTPATYTGAWGPASGPSTGKHPEAQARGMGPGPLLLQRGPRGAARRSSRRGSETIEMQFLAGVSLHLPRPAAGGASRTRCSRCGSMPGSRWPT